MVPLLRKFNRYSPSGTRTNHKVHKKRCFSAIFRGCIGFTVFMGKLSGSKGKKQELMMLRENCQRN